MSAKRLKELKITGVTVSWDVENIWQLSFDGVSSTSFMLSDHIFHLYMRRYELSIAIYLCRDDTIPVVMPLLCKLCMVDHIGQETLIGEKEVVVGKEKEFVLLESVMISDLERQRTEFLANDTFTINCSLSTSYRVNVLNQQNPKTQEIISRFGTLSSDLESFYKTQKNADTILRVENTEFPVHQSILAARCPQLASMLHPGEILDIPDFSASVIQDVLCYIYTGKIQALTSESVTKMVVAANRFSLNELKEVCIEFLRSSLTESTVFDAAVIAHEYGDLLLKEEVEQYMVKHVATILQSEKWKNFCSQRYKFANEILTSVLLRMQKTSNEKGNTEMCTE